MSRNFFLAKSGKSYGPYTQEHIEGLRESGEYERYSWLWDGESGQWQPIDPPPAPPALAQSAPRPERPLARSVSALCYNQQSAVSGWLAHVTDAGCELVSTSPASAPEFQAKLPVLLHLFDPVTGRSMNVSARVGQAERQEDRWRYRLHWKRCPELLEQSAA